MKQKTAIFTIQLEILSMKKYDSSNKDLNKRVQQLTGYDGRSITELEGEVQDLSQKASEKDEEVDHGTKIKSYGK